MKKKIYSETMWAISGQWDWNRKPFLYAGTRLTRKDAIEDFIKDRGQTWKQLRRQGDRAVRVTITWQE